MKKTLLLIILLASSACSVNPSRYDLKSPCVANEYSPYSDSGCQRRLPLENFIISDTIATS